MEPNSLKNGHQEDGHVDPMELIVHHTELPDTVPSRAIDRFVDRIGSLTSWLWVVVMIVILVSVVSRYAFGKGSIMLEEIQWHLYGVAWLIGLSYTLVHDAHVRVDVLHERLGLKGQVWIEFLGILLLLMPFLLITVYYSVPYFLSSYGINERALAPDGLPARWVLKFFIPLSILLLSVAAVSRLLRCTALLFGTPQAHKSNKPA